jgi:hypothetical protein
MPAHLNSYCVVKIPEVNGDYLVHRSDCTYIPETNLCEGLGTFAHCSPALSAAQKIFVKANACRYCAPECHQARSTDTA